MLRMTPASRAGVDARSAPRRRRPGTRVERDAEPLRSRGVGQILDTALDVLAARFGPCVLIAVVFWIPYQLATELINSSGVPIELQLGWTVSALVPELLTTAGVCSFVGAHLLGRRIATDTAMRVGLAAGAGVLVIAVMQTFATLVLALCCVVPFVLGYWLFAVTPTVYVLERKRIGDERAAGYVWPLRWVAEILLSVERGAKLVFGLGSFGRWAGWATVSLLTVLTPLSLVPVGLENPGVRTFMEETLKLQGRPIEIALFVLSALFLGVGTAYSAILKTVYYLDERVRKEAFDLEMRLDRIELRTAPLER